MGIPIQFARTMPVFFGLFVEADVCDLERVTFPDSAEWSFTVQKRGQRDIDECPVQAQVSVSTDSEGLEWHDLRGIDRAVCDRSERQGTVRLLKDMQKRRGHEGAQKRRRNKRQPEPAAKQYGQLVPGMSAAPLVVLAGHGCEPVEWHQTSSALLLDSDGSLSEDSDVAFEGGVLTDTRGRTISGLRYE